jgi:hypothetical protein
MECLAKGIMGGGELTGNFSRRPQAGSAYFR